MTRLSEANIQLSSTRQKLKQFQDRDANSTEHMLNNLLRMQSDLRDRQVGMFWKLKHGDDLLTRARYDITMLLSKVHKDLPYANMCVNFDNGLESIRAS